MAGISNNYNFKRVDYQKPQNEKEEKPVVEEKKAEVKQPKESTKSVDLGQQASAVYGQAMVQSHKPEAPEDETPVKPVGDSEEDSDNPVLKTKYYIWEYDERGNQVRKKNPDGSWAYKEKNDGRDGSSTCVYFNGQYCDDNLVPIPGLN